MTGAHLKFLMLHTWALQELNGNTIFTLVLNEIPFAAVENHEKNIGLLTEAKRNDHW